MRFLILTLIMTIASTSGAWNMKDYKKPSNDELKKKLTTLQYDVTQKEGTEPPFAAATIPVSPPVALTCPGKEFTTDALISATTNNGMALSFIVL